MTKKRQYSKNYRIWIERHGDYGYTDFYEDMTYRSAKALFEKLREDKTIKKAELLHYEDNGLEPIDYIFNGNIIEVKFNSEDVIDLHIPELDDIDDD